LNLSIEQLMKDAAEYHGITVEELRHRLIVNGEPLMHEYYVGTGGI